MFDSPTAAAMAVNGRRASGWKAWTEEAIDRRAARDQASSGLPRRWEACRPAGDFGPAIEAGIGFGVWPVGRTLIRPAGVNIG